ncbi:MAG: DUF2065 domain-containing protein [Rhodospirillaceae bacterium]|nr:DUF2065 domain-containing protein [Rhodospirillales bacterium]
MKDFLTACSLALVIEGVAYALFPGAMQRGLAAILAMPPNALRLVGLVAATTGVAGVWLVRAAITAP